MLEEELPLEEKPVEEKPIEEPVIADLDKPTPFAKRTAIRTMLKKSGVGITIADRMKLATEREMRTSLLALCKVTEAEYRAAGGKL
jgi:hypothetical protein